MVSPFAVRVPAGIYLLRGLRLETKRNLKRRLLWLMERISSSLATKVQSVSKSLRHEYINLGLCAPDKIIVLGCGSSNGVELLDASEIPDCVRVTIGLERDTPVVGFVGRLAKDKGLPTLLSAVRKVLESGTRSRFSWSGRKSLRDPSQKHWARPDWTRAT